MLILNLLLVCILILILRFFAQNFQSVQTSASPLQTRTSKIISFFPVSASFPFFCETPQIMIRRFLYCMLASSASITKSPLVTSSEISSSISQNFAQHGQLWFPRSVLCSCNSSACARLGCAQIVCFRRRITSWPRRPRTTKTATRKGQT